MSTLPSPSADAHPDTPLPRLLVAAPLDGTAIPLRDVPDPVFAATMVGPGAAIDPERVRQRTLSPLAGRLVKVKPHAFVVAHVDGRHVLVHLGIDTVGLRDGFEPLAAEGDEVAAGAPVVTWDPAAVAARGLSPVCAVVALDTPRSAITVVAGERPRPISAGEPLFRWF